MFAGGGQRADLEISAQRKDGSGGAGPGWQGRDIDKGLPAAADAVADIGDGASIAVGGFGLCGVPFALIDALYERGSSELSVVSNNCGTIGRGLGRLLDAGRIVRAMSSYVGENKELARRYLSGEIELELAPQGTLSERLGARYSAIPTSTGRRRGRQG